ncbi:MAG: MEDS domain-containing protein [Thermoproteota archaeon]|nr:MEDS domain-containing protein [Thermoproteota archaeon]
MSDNSNDVLKQLRQAEFGAHYIIVYPDMMTLRQIYSRYIKAQIEDDNEIILMLPYYETTEMVRSILSGENNNNNNGGRIIDVRKYEKEGSLIIIDSVKAYFGSDIDLMSFVEKLAKKAQSSGKSGVSVIADLASFYYYNQVDKLIDYEMSLPTKYDDQMKLKGFCLYHQEDFDKRLSKEQKQKLLEHHSKNIMLVN